MAHRSEATWNEVQHLVAAFEALLEGVRRSADPACREAARSLEQGLTSHRNAVASGQHARWPVGLRTGLRQGAREIPIFLSRLPADERERVTKEVFAAGGRWLAALLRATDRRIDSALARGHIRTDDEFYSLRAAVDELESSQAHDSRLRRLWALLDQYDTPS